MIEPLKVSFMIIIVVLALILRIFQFDELCNVRELEIKSEEIKDFYIAVDQGGEIFGK